MPLSRRRDRVGHRLRHADVGDLLDHRLRLRAGDDAGPERPTPASASIFSSTCAEHALDLGLLRRVEVRVAAARRDVLGAASSGCRRGSRMRRRSTRNRCARRRRRPRPRTRSASRRCSPPRVAVARRRGSRTRGGRRRRRPSPRRRRSSCPARRPRGTPSSSSPATAGSNGRRAMPTIFFTLRERSSESTSAMPRSPVGPVTVTVRPSAATAAAAYSAATRSRTSQLASTRSSASARTRSRPLPQFTTSRSPSARVDEVAAAAGRDHVARRCRRSTSSLPAARADAVRVRAARRRSRVRRPCR